jgi:hypothetical protein
LWHVVHEVWYFRENAGIAFARGAETKMYIKTPTRTKMALRRK